MDLNCENRVHAVFSKTHDYRISNFVSHFSIRSVCDKLFLSYCTLQGFPCEKQQQTLFHRVRDDTGNKIHQELCLPGVHGFPGTRELGDLYSLPLFCSSSLFACQFSNNKFMSHTATFHYLFSSQSYQFG